MPGEDIANAVRKRSGAIVDAIRLFEAGLTCGKFALAP